MKKILFLSLLTMFSINAKALDVTITFSPAAGTVPSKTSDLVNDSAFSPIGSISMFSGDTPPAGWMIAKGDSLLQTDYPALFSAIGIKYGQVDATHFNLPNAQGLFARGAGSQVISSKNYAGGAVGDKVVDATAKNGISDSGHSHNTLTGVRNNVYGSTGTGWGLDATGKTSNINAINYDSYGLGISNNSANLVSSDSESRPATIAFHYIIKVK